MKGTTYARIELARCSGAIEGSLTSYVEQLIDADMRARGVPVVEKVPPREKKKADVDEIIGHHFTF